MIGPHIILPTEAALSYASAAGIVKAVNDPRPLRAALPTAIKVYRRTWGDGTHQLELSGRAVVDALIEDLRGWNDPLLYLELLNEVHGEMTSHLDWTWWAAAHAHARGYRVAGFSWATGAYQPADWEQARRAHWVGVDAVAVHAYWGLPPDGTNPGAVLTPWNALRYRNVWQPGDPPILITESGRDRVRDGDPAVDDGWVGLGWRRDGIANPQYLAELRAFDAEISRDAYVLGATIFSAGTTPDWGWFDIDSLVPALLTYASRVPAPEPHQPVQDGKDGPLAGEVVSQPADTGQEAPMPQPITPEQLGPGFWALYEQMGHKTGGPIEGTWSVMRAGEPEQSVLEIVRFRNGRAVWDRDSNCVVYIGKDRLVMRAYDGKVTVLLP